jgi:hypothetical protein
MVSLKEIVRMAFADLPRLDKETGAEFQNCCIGQTSNSHLRCPNMHNSTHDKGNYHQYLDEM